ncbi:hypothetical protein [Terrisporobacter sp.]
MRKIIKSIMCIIFAISIILVGSMKINASTSYRLIEQKTKVGNYYIWSNPQKGIYISKSKLSSGTRILKAPSSNEYLGYGIITNGSKIYYTVRNGNYDTKDYMTIYRIDVSGRNKKYIKKVSHGDNLRAYYGEKLYINRHDCNNKYGCDGTYIHTYVYDLSSKKLSLLKKDYTINFINGQYFLGSANTGDYGPLPIHLYNAKINKLYKISSSGANEKFLNGKIYYADIKNIYSSNKKVYIKCCSYTGNNQKTLCTLNMGTYGGHIESINSTYVKYAKYNKNGNSTYYKCIYKTGKIVKITE